MSRRWRLSASTPRQKAFWAAAGANIERLVDEFRALV